uniref:Ig-like domain-containing protein n=1 Tax=Calidris pygmaea TaxID=425635 RepID=A0A8C3PRW2_9CHAR
MSSYFCVNWMLLVLSTGSTVSELLVKGKVGQDITVPCSYRVQNRQDITSMCWGRDKCPTSKCSQTIIWTDGWKVTEQSNSRYTLKGDLQRGDVSLTIVNAVEADSGTYCCRVEISGWFNDQLRNYNVVVEKAPGSTNESSFTITRTWPPVSASEAPQTAPGPCSNTSDCWDVTSNMQNPSVSRPRQQYSENWLYIGIGLCVVLLVILFLSLFIIRRKYFSQVVIQVGWVPEIAGVAHATCLLLQGSELTSLDGHTLCPALWLLAHLSPLASGAQNSKVPMWSHHFLSRTL